MSTPEEQTISASCNLPSKYVLVQDSKIHYLQQGEGDPILFVHGMPTSSYLWRNIIPHLSDLGCCIALDMIGMGKSDKPDIDYSVFDHIKYLEGFIKVLDLKNITLVLHGWGSLPGFDYASRFEKNIKGLVFYESHLRPNVEWDMLSLPVQQLATLLNKPGASYKAIVEHNYLVKKLLPHGVLRKLSNEEILQYEAPFPTPDSRKPLWQYVTELPLGTEDGEVVELISKYSKWLTHTDIPKLLLYAVPGFTTTIETVQWARSHLSNLVIEELPDALHFAQESNPVLFSKKLREWYLEHISK